MTSHDILTSHHRSDFCIMPFKSEKSVKLPANHIFSLGDLDLWSLTYDLDMDKVDFHVKFLALTSTGLVVRVHTHNHGTDFSYIDRWCREVKRTMYCKKTKDCQFIADMYSALAESSKYWQGFRFVRTTEFFCDTCFCCGMFCQTISRGQNPRMSVAWSEYHKRCFTVVKQQRKEMSHC